MKIIKAIFLAFLCALSPDFYIWLQGKIIEKQVFDTFKKGGVL